MSDNTNNNNNEDKLEIDLSTESLQIDLNDLKTDIELNFDNLENTVDVTPIDDNQPIENISLMSNNAPTVEEPISQELSLSEPSLSEPTVEEPVLQEPSLSEPSLSEPTVEEPPINEQKEENIPEDFTLVDRFEEETPVEATPQDDATPIASTDPNSDPLGMDWQEPISASSNNSSNKTGSSFATNSSAFKASMENNKEHSTNDNSSSKNDVSVNITDNNSKKKNNKKVPIIVGSIVAVFAILIGVGFYLVKINPVTSNTIMSTVLKPNKYYQMIEGKNIGKIMSSSGEDIGNKISTLKDKANEAIATNTTITLSEGLTSFTSVLGPYASLINSIKTVSVKSDVITQDKKSSCILELVLNDKTIVDVNLVLDQENKSMYVQCPSLLKRWIKIPVTNLDNDFDFSKGKQITPEDIKTIMNTYLPILITNFDNVKLNKGKNITVDNSKIDVSEIIITISKENEEKITNKLLNQLKKDDLVFSYLQSYGIFKTKDEYKKAIKSIKTNMEKAIKQNKELLENASDDEKTKIEKVLKEMQEPKVMTVFVDKKGEIIGRNFESCDSTLSYLYYDSGDVSKFTFKVSADELKINANGNVVDKNKTYSGNATIDVEYKPLNGTTKSSSDDETKNIKIALKYNNLKTVNEKKGLFKGNFNISASGIKNIKGASLDLKFSVQNNRQASEVIVNYLNQPLLGIATTEDTSKQSGITVPTAFIDQEKLTSDYLTQYNVLLEVDTYTPVVNIMTALNNPIVKQLVAAYYVQPGYRFLNGSQNAKHLIYIARKTNNTQLYKLAGYGYKMTLAGKNPGLDAQK